MFHHKIRVFFITGVVCIAVSWGLPIRSQEVTAEEPQAEEVQTDQQIADPAEALTAKDPNIPLDELQLLLKPLTKSQLENEAAAWQLVLQEKVQEISDTEIAIKYPESFLKKQQETAALEAAEKAKQAQTNQLIKSKKVLAEAQAKQENIDFDSEEYEDLTAKIRRLEVTIKNFEHIQGIQASTAPDTSEYAELNQLL